MKRLISLVVLAVVVAVVVLFVAGKPRGPVAKSSGGQPPGQLNVRKAAVAGMFYPAPAKELGRMVDDLLARAKPVPLQNLRALVCPHAGYRYSGAVAACAYKQLVGRNVETVMILSPSHYARFKGASVPDVGAYETPLGKMLLSPLAARLARKPPFVCGPKCEVRRPAWWRRSPKELPPFGDDTPHTWEHSLEVQIPFLQKTAPQARIVPVVYGQVDPQKVAEALAGHITGTTVLVASSDLSHYKPYEMAKHMDAACIAAMLQLDVEDMKDQHACGKGPILTLLHLAKQKGWRARLLDYCNSGDTAGDKSGVVGYAAVAFYKPPAQQAAAGPYTPKERKFLLSLARKTLTAVVGSKRLPDFDVARLTGRVTEKRGCFVTLNKQGRLRGCIGHIFPHKPLCLAVMANAVSAALRDKRFPPVQAEDLGEIRIEISILTRPKLVDFRSPEDLLSKLRPKTDGVVLRVGSRQATYLPQVWDHYPKKEQFMDSLARKAGLPVAAWRKEGVVIHTYQAEVFRESEP